MKTIIRPGYPQPVVQRYDEKGRETYVEYPNGRWLEVQYDEVGNEIYWKNSNEFWKRNEFDEYGNIIHSISSNEYEGWMEYDKNGKMTYLKGNNGSVFGKPRNKG